MDTERLIELVETYFAGVDGKDFERVENTLAEDCVFTVETHGVRLVGLEAIRGMMERLWAEHRSVLHQNFVHVADPENGRIASRFDVVNTDRDGSRVHKSNCNFFEMRDGQFQSVAVYMAGENTLHAN